MGRFSGLQSAREKEASRHIYIAFETQPISLGTLLSYSATLSSLHRVTGEVEAGVRFPDFYGRLFAQATLLFYF